MNILGILYGFMEDINIVNEPFLHHLPWKLWLRYGFMEHTTMVNEPFLHPLPWKPMVKIISALW